MLSLSRNQRRSTQKERTGERERESEDRQEGGHGRRERTKAGRG